MNESETRAELIDPHLAERGWQVVPESRIRREYPITKGRLIGNNKRTAPSKADYILQYKNRNVAVLEAKATTCYYTEGLGQAKDYADTAKRALGSHSDFRGSRARCRFGKNITTRR